MNIQTDPHRNLAEALAPLSTHDAADFQPYSPHKGAVALYLPVLCVVLGLVGAGAYLWLRSSTLGPDAAVPVPSLAAPPLTATQATTPAPVGGSQVALSARPVEITGSGYLVAQETVRVFAKYEGIITEVLVDLGDAVVAGQPLLQIRDPGAQFEHEKALIEQEQAQLALDIRSIALAQARRDFGRQQALFATGATAERAMQDAASELALARATRAQAEQDLRRADLNLRIATEHLEELTIRAPIAGEVTDLSARVGSSVLARADTIRESDSLLVLTDTTSMYLEAEVAETNISHLQAGLRGEAVLDGMPDQPFGFRIAGLSPVVAAETGTLSLRLAVDAAPKGVRPNMAARIRIRLAPL